MEALNNGIIETISTDAEGHEMVWLLEAVELFDDTDIEVGILLFEFRIDINGTTELRSGEDFFDAKRVNGDVGEDFIVLIACKTGNTVSGIFDED